MSKRILLSNSGDWAIVDNQDYDYLNQFNWYLDRNGYAAAHIDGKTQLMHEVVAERAGIK